jgi:hypothetical protein
MKIGKAKISSVEKNNNNSPQKHLGILVYQSNI